MREEGRDNVSYIMGWSGVVIPHFLFVFCEDFLLLDSCCYVLLKGVGVRSKTCILVKNLPACTQAQEIEKLFLQYGEVLRVVLPPSGITAVVHMPVPFEAQEAFKRLAYKRFGDAPLYLEWAPTGIMGKEQQAIEKAKHVKQEEETQLSKNKDHKVCVSRILSICERMGRTM